MNDIFRFQYVVEIVNDGNSMLEANANDTQELHTKNT